MGLSSDSPQLTTAVQCCLMQLNGNRKETDKTSCGLRRHVSEMSHFKCLHSTAWLLEDKLKQAIQRHVLFDSRWNLIPTFCSAEWKTHLQTRFVFGSGADLWLCLEIRIEPFKLCVVRACVMTCTLKRKLPFTLCPPPIPHHHVNTHVQNERTNESTCEHYHPFSHQSS